MINFIDSGSVTIAAAHTTGGAIGTIKLINGFYNPVASGVNAAIYGVTIATVSGTPAGPLYWNYITGSVLTNTVTGTIQQALLGSGKGATAMTPEVNIVLTQAAGTPSFVQCGVVGGSGAAAITGNLNSIFVSYFRPGINYFYLVPPGATFGLTATGAGTTHIVQTTIYWEEVPI